MKPLIISCSLHPNSRSRVLANTLKEKIPQADLLDLRDYPLPLCDGKEAYNHESLPVLAKKLQNASGIIIAAPIYNYNLNAALKNFIELLGKKMAGKLIAFLCAAGGKSSYMAPLSTMNSLMLDFRCIILPRFVYATGADFNEERTKVTNTEVLERLDKLQEEFTKVNNALSKVKLE